MRAEVLTSLRSTLGHYEAILARAIAEERPAHILADLRHGTAHYRWLLAAVHASPFEAGDRPCPHGPWTSITVAHCVECGAVGQHLLPPTLSP